MYVGHRFSPYSLLFGGEMGGRGVHRWRGGSEREEEGEEGNPIVWGVDGLIELQKMGGRERKEKRHSCGHDGLILSLPPPFLSSQLTLSNTLTIPLSSTHHSLSLFHCSLHSPIHYTPFHTALTTLSHYTTDNAL